jgi:hypothetical protein
VSDRLRRLGYVLFGFGAALMLEKIVNYGAAFTYPPILDHGLYGLLAIVAAFIILSRREREG